MKGVVFTELFDLVESAHGYEILDRVIEKCELENQGGYTSVGTYSCSELVKIVSALSEELQTPIPDLVRMFGGHLFGRFFERHSDHLNQFESAFDLLLAVEDIIHVEVRKLWPNAELPTFEYPEIGPNRLMMNYQSTRPFADLCEGLIVACIEHYGESIEVVREDKCPQGTAAVFTLTKLPQTNAEADNFEATADGPS